MESSGKNEEVEEIKSQWKRMWRERVDDHEHAEGIAVENYDKLFVERGTVVLATRNFKLLTLNDIFELHKVVNAERWVQPSPSVGGWGKFIRSHITNCRRTTRTRALVSERRTRLLEHEAKRPRQLKKSGRGWLHI